MLLFDVELDVEFRKEFNMKWVEISEFNPETEKSTVFATAVLSDAGQITFEGETSTFPESIPAPEGDRQITPNDGIDYLLALKREFNNAYAMASDIREGER